MAEQQTIRLISEVDAHPQRSNNCGELRESNVGQNVVLKGWVDTRRDLGGVIFIDLRDRYGLTQIVLSPQDNQEAYNKAESLRTEDVISIEGLVRPRSEETKNQKLPTGSVEVSVQSLFILNTSQPVPFAVSSHEEKRKLANEELRLRYRYLDLRRPELLEKLVLRHHIYQTTRSVFVKHGFLEVETPMLMKSTPEGARDFLVPSRIHAGQFYALPQSPQTYKQILMIAGLDRYFQIVKCFRDEDLRADRQPEFTQVDVEISFATEEIIYSLIEDLMSSLFRESKGIEVPVPFPRMSYHDAVHRYGSDKPDLRFGLEIHDISKDFEGSGFRVFDNVIDSGGKIVAIKVPGEGDRGRGAMDRLDKDIVRKRIGAGGLVYFKLPSDGSAIHCSVKAEVLPTEFVDNAVKTVGAEAGDLVLVLAGTDPKVFEQMGTLRLHLAKDLNMIPAGDAGPWNFLWVTDFPLLDWDEDGQRFHAMHHPFTSPLPEDFDKLFEEPGAVRARAYDLVLNGHEIGGGSIRIHSREIQNQMFKLLNIEEEEASRRFGFLLEALEYGAPPHGGIAMGLDRIAMIMAGTENIRDVIAFPKTQSAQELMVSSPDIVDDHQLKDLHIRVEMPPEEKK
ncbi:MAG: aspartate--tRNA ligase [Rhodothermales bacterium]